MTDTLTGLRNPRERAGRVHIDSGRRVTHLIQFRVVEHAVSVCGTQFRYFETGPIQANASSGLCPACLRRSGGR